MIKDIPSVEPVYKLFKQLNRVPRPSHYEGRAALFITRFAEKLGLEYECDAQNNVVIRKPATSGYEDAEPIVLLNHMDMVCVAADGVVYDPLHDSIKAVVEDGWMHAEGTSLGADNGIGLSMALAILQDDSIKHGPLEVLTTTNEEDGMTGAEALSSDFIKGRTVINLDSEDYDSITMAAAGACIQEAGMRARRITAPKNFQFYSVKISGGPGGHSGVDINKGRGNVAFIMVGLLLLINKKLRDWYCASLECGNAAASIPSLAQAVIGLPANEDIDNFKKLVKSSFTKAKKFCQKQEPGLKLSITKVKPQTEVIVPEDTIAMLDTVMKVPNGVQKMRQDMPDVVQTSSNLGIIKSEKGYFDIFIHSRSFSDNQLEGLALRIAHIFKENEGSYKIIMNAPAWQEKSDSAYMKLVDDTFQDVLGFRPRKAAMHFVLEAGYYVQKYSGIQIASIGPRIVEPHSPSERVELSTVEDIWKVTIELLARLAEQKRK